MNQPLASTDHRYERVAETIVRAVQAGTLGIGERAPSLRSVCAQHRVSMSTALQAYRLLEDRGVLEARPKSGFFVIGNGDAARRTPSPSAPPATAVPVAIGRNVTELHERASDPSYLPLGCAIPDTELLASGGLDRFLARAARVHGVRYNVYAPPRGDADLRRELSRRALRLGHVLSPEDIAITCGCTEALSLALRATCRPGDTVAIESPVYFGLLQILENLGLKALELPTDAELGLEPAPLEKAVASGAVAACLLSSCFNNPLGCLMSADRKRAIVDLLARHAIPLIEDDIYGDIYFGDERPKTFAALAPDADIITCSSFSKTLAPGYRIGWVAAPRRIQSLLDIKFGTTLCGPALPQKALGDYLASGGYDSHLRRMRRVFADNIRRMTQAVDRSFPTETRVSAPKGGFVLWLELPAGIDALELYRAATAERICFAPGSVFTASGGYSNFMRLSCGHSWNARIERGVERLGELATAAHEGRLTELAQAD